MKIYITLLLILPSIMVKTAQLSKPLTRDEAAEQICQSIADDNLVTLKKLLQDYPGAIDAMPQITIVLPRLKHTWGENIVFPLNYAARYNKPEALCLLLEYGALLNLTNLDRSTALMWAAMSDYYDCAKILIEARANKEIENSHHQTALSIAESQAGLTSRRSEYEEAMKKYHQAIANGEAERDRYAQEKPLALQELTNVIGITDLAVIIHGYAYGVLPRDLPKQEKVKPIQAEPKSKISSECEIQ